MKAEKCKWAKVALWDVLSLDARKFFSCVSTCNFSLRTRMALFFFAHAWFIFFVLHYNILCWRLGMSHEKKAETASCCGQFINFHLEDFSSLGALYARRGNKSLGNKALSGWNAFSHQSVWRRRAFCAKIIWEKWDINFAEWHNVSSVVH